MAWLTVSNASGCTLILPMQFVQTRSLAVGRRNPPVRVFQHHHPATLADKRLATAEVLLPQLFS